jgi:hypothetical protein
MENLRDISPQIIPPAFAAGIDDPDPLSGLSRQRERLTAGHDFVAV